ncbi:ArdC family protein [Marinivivus vitaminiproducens]|uniref:ArdC family protein n=1 Tax=Marinivivus vitaminiproducens TaxID=3035935 RepID=UPI0027A0E4D0|nr:zincin-like metallopeptidase domain-containing protein [Geminicoccaceae bacterium SCSIO 64248]
MAKRNKHGPASARRDVHAEITQTIVAQLEQGAAPWRQPWQAGHPAGSITRPLRHNLVPYKGINVLILWLQAVLKGYSAPIWMTFNQAKTLGGQVRKGETSALVVKAGSFDKAERDEATGEAITVTRTYYKGYHVFCVEQIDGLPDSFYAPARHLTNHERIEPTERFFAHTGAQIDEGGEVACYIPALDMIRMPPLGSFDDAESYYSTLAHEHIHWTRDDKRLQRNYSSKYWNGKYAAAEELVAELGACFLAADLGLSPDPRDGHASYLSGWLDLMRGDSRVIFKAATLAEQAVDYLHGLQPQTRVLDEAA